MFANLSAAAAAGNGGFPVIQLITLLVVVAVLYPLQKRIRAAAARQRRERWERDGLLEQPAPDEPGEQGDWSKPDDASESPPESSPDADGKR